MGGLPVVDHDRIGRYLGRGWRNMDDDEGGVLPLSQWERSHHQCSSVDENDVASCHLSLLVTRLGPEARIRVRLTMC
jgi:hypothetical protein